MIKLDEDFEKTYGIVDAARYLKITELELEGYTNLGLIKHKTLWNAQRVYFEADLKKFSANIFIPISIVVKAFKEKYLGN